MFTEQTLHRLWPHGDSKVPGLIAGIVAAQPRVYAKYGINSDLLIAHAMAQFSHECGAGQEMTENTHYTAERAVQVWPSRFESVNDCYNKIGSFEGDPDFAGKLIDSVYGSRMGNRPGTHDGRKYIGRGLPQTTGRDGYTDLGTRMGRDFLTRPEDVNKPENALECGIADFILCGCLPFALKDDIVSVSAMLNVGHIVPASKIVGLAERKQWLAHWKDALATQVVPVPAPKPPVIHPKHATGLAAIIAAIVAALQAHEPAVIAIVIALGIGIAIALHFLWKTKAPAPQAPQPPVPETSPAPLPETPPSAPPEPPPTPPSA